MMADDTIFSPSHETPHPTKAIQVTVARYKIANRVQPSIAQALCIGDCVHDALCKLSDKVQPRPTVFTGLDNRGNPLTNHPHAHIFSETNGLHDKITHITIWARMGFNEDAAIVLQRLKTIWGHSRNDLHLELSGLGQPADFPECSLFRESRTWHSLTPFVSTRHPKTFRDGRPKIDQTGWQVGSTAHDLLRLIGVDQSAVPAKIRQNREIHIGGRGIALRDYQMTRKNGRGRIGSNPPGAFTIIFNKPVSGPLAFGYGAHFGLGLFVPAKGEIGVE